MNNRLNREMNNRLNRVMGKFIGEMEWDIFTTLSYKDICKEHFNRKLMENYFQKNRNLINRMFFISERCKNYINVHSHFLISSNSPNRLMIKNNPLYRWGDVQSVLIDNEMFVTEEGVLNVGYYITKFFDKNVDWDIFL
jgi:hypothetical protein